jgi:NADH:ubiquinone oxidoreductase subunit 3 (subunit A)
MIEYTNILLFLIIGAGLSGVIVGASYLFSVKAADQEKVSVYECGFDPFGDSRKVFEVRFFLVGILFIIFDLEISFLFP